MQAWIPFLIGAAHVVVALSVVAHGAFFWKEAIDGKKLLMDSKTFGFSEDLAAQIAPLLVNSGVYNLGITIGLALSFVPGPHQFVARIFFLSFATVAGIVGLKTLPRALGAKAFIGQSVVGVIALILVLVSSQK